ncbi:MAG: hypothetical protein J5715_03030 [Clostridiales bacterium]|nr:hypothetical protein [Clostridiales bacterium]
MSDLVNVIISDEYLSVSFDVAQPKIMAIGEKMNELCEEAYMNGYNWEAFLNCYLDENAPEILDVIESDPEAEMYSVFIEEVNDETRALAEKFGEILDDLFNNEDKIYSFLKDNAENIEWD